LNQSLKCRFAATDMLLNDDADLDWLEAEAPDLDIDMHDFNARRHSSEDRVEGDDSLPQVDVHTADQAENRQHVCPVGSESAWCPGDFITKDSNSRLEKAGHRTGKKRKHRQEDDGEIEPGEDEFAFTATAGESKISRFERYEKRCQRRESLPAHHEQDAAPLRRHTRSCREHADPMPAASDPVGHNHAEPVRSGVEPAAGQENSVVVPEWPGAAISSTTATMAMASQGQSPLQWEPAVQERKEPVVTPAQLRQLYAQVQAHTQLLVQTLAMAAPAGISPAVSDDLVKLWGWRPDSITPERRKEMVCCRVLIASERLYCVVD
jgi:hypothetical protein